VRGEAITLFGIVNCDSCRKARRWLDGQGIDYRFHDLRADGLTVERLNRWLAAVGWETLLNRRGRSWRELPAEQREDPDESRARTLLERHPLLVKRPVLEAGQTVLVGFDAARYKALLKHG
jgi:arsenate reductase